MRSDRAERGRAIRRKAFGAEGERRLEGLRAIDSGHAEYILESCFGTVWARPGLDLKIRELIVIAAAVAQDLPGEVELHVRGALNRGATRQEVIETIIQCVPYVGLPKANHGLQAAQRVFDQWAERKDWHAQ